MLKRPIKRLILRWRLLRQRDRRIIVGAGGYGQAGWISTDITSLNLLREGDWRALLAEGSLAAILAEHVWEHLDPADALEAARRCRRYLRPGGHLRIAVPDGLSPDPAYLAQVRPGGSGPGADDHRALYTYRTLGDLLAQAGLAPRPLEYFDEAGTFHASDWDPADGIVRRSRRFDRRNSDGRLVYTSLIVDAIRP
jgi:predicted SAM-dependent methyltransferase